MTRSSFALLLALIVAGTFGATSAEAQVCDGAGPFSNGPVRIGIGGGSLGTGFGGAGGEGSAGTQLALGAADGGPFASVSGSIVLYTDESHRFALGGPEVRTNDDTGALIIGFAGGYSMLVSTSRQVELCPMAGFSWQTGPDGWSDCTAPTGGTTCSGSVQGSARASWLGGSVGTRFSRVPALVPFAQAALVRSTMIWAAEGGSESRTDHYIPITVGTGLVFERFTLRGGMTFPQGLDVGNPTAGLLLAFNIGHKTPR